MQTKLDFLIERVQKQNPQANIKKIRAAYECAAKAHEGQKRRNGEPYIIHPVAVAEIVVEMGLDTDSICAALLHDCIEDTEFGYKEIENKFGTPVAELVDGVTRLGMLRYSKEQEQFEDLRKMFLAMAKDIRVILISYHFKEGMINVCLKPYEGKADISGSVVLRTLQSMAG